ncbi:BRO family protein [Roseovarius ramblicola]|uniref:BRO family protein n=1 Tax=Roseovarius ramblicola TaxID=2022336 RepID=A0ABV5HX82_9RHOB
MNDIIPFDFESHAVRSVLIDGKPWFVAADVCRVLEIVNHRHAVSTLDEDEKGVVKTDTLGGKQDLNIVSVSGVIWLSSRSNKPVAKRFWKWVRAEVLPALVRDGYYAMPGAAAPDLEELAEKRAYLESLPEDQREIARAKCEALDKIADAIEAGEKVSHAVREAAAESGYSEKTLWNCRANTYMVPRSDWEAACAPKWRRRRGGMMVECHPEALRFFEGLAATGQRITDCYRRTCEVAAERGWEPVPGIHVLRRHAARVLSNPVRRSVSA